LTFILGETPRTLHGHSTDAPRKVQLAACLQGYRQSQPHYGGCVAAVAGKRTGDDGQPPLNVKDTVWVAKFVIMGEDLRFGKEKDEAEKNLNYDLDTNLRCVEMSKRGPVTKKRESR
jgi:hypothetical protein